jgi:hypothetical protein
MLTESAISTIRTQPPLLPPQTHTHRLSAVHPRNPEIHETNRETTRNSQHTTRPFCIFPRVPCLPWFHDARSPHQICSDEPARQCRAPRAPTGLVRGTRRASASPPTAGQKNSGATNRSPRPRAGCRFSRLSTYVGISISHVVLYTSENRSQPKPSKVTDTGKCQKNRSMVRTGRSHPPRETSSC